MKYVTLNDGHKMPMLGLGTWNSPPGEVYDAIRTAIDVGYRHFDCAHVYRNEKEVGQAIRSKIDEKVIQREDIFITSKLWNTYHRVDLVEPALKTTLANLQLDYLDLYLIHWPMAFQEGGELFPVDEKGKKIYSHVDYLDTWKEMEKMVEKKLTKSIGISNFNSQQVTRVLKIAKIKPVTNQIECHPYLNQNKLMQFCEERGITITAYSPLGSPNRPWAKPDDPKLLNEPKLQKIADRYGKTVAQILIRYQIDRGNIVIPKSVTKKRIADNFAVFNFELSAEDIALIDKFDCNGRIVSMEDIKDHPHFPFSIEF